jgi:hypothetical protein
MNHWFGAKFLACVHAHSRDHRVRYVDHRRFYIRWQEIRDTETTFEDTVSVTNLVCPPSLFELEVQSTQEREQSRQKGLVLHRALECYYNGLTSAFDVLDPVLSPIVRQYIADTEHMYLPWRTEMAVFSDLETRIVGVLDAVFVDVNGMDSDVLVVHLRDWKYSSQSPLVTIQLNLYTYLLEEFYKDIVYQGKTYKRIQVQSMALVYFHETYGYRTIQVPREKQILIDILERRRSICRTETTRRRRVVEAEEDEIPL